MSRVPINSAAQIQSPSNKKNASWRASLASASALSAGVAVGSGPRRYLETKLAKPDSAFFQKYAPSFGNVSRFKETMRDLFDLTQRWGVHLEHFDRAFRSIAAANIVETVNSKHNLSKPTYGEHLGFYQNGRRPHWIYRADLTFRSINGFGRSDYVLLNNYYNNYASDISGISFLCVGDELKQGYNSLLSKKDAHELPIVDSKNIEELLAQYKSGISSNSARPTSLKFVFLEHPASANRPVVAPYGDVWSAFQRTVLEKAGQFGIVDQISFSNMPIEGEKLRLAVDLAKARDEGVAKALKALPVQAQRYLIETANDDARTKHMETYSDAERAAIFREDVRSWPHKGDWRGYMKRQRRLVEPAITAQPVREFTISGVLKRLESLAPPVSLHKAEEILASCKSSAVDKSHLLQGASRVERVLHSLAQTGRSALMRIKPDGKTGAAVLGLLAGAAAFYSLSKHKGMQKA